MIGWYWGKNSDKEKIGRICQFEGCDDKLLYKFVKVFSNINKISQGNILTWH